MHMLIRLIPHITGMGMVITGPAIPAGPYQTFIIQAMRRGVQLVQPGMPIIITLFFQEL